MYILRYKHRIVFIGIIQKDAYFKWAYPPNSAYMHPKFFTSPLILLELHDFIRPAAEVSRNQRKTRE